MRSLTRVHFQRPLAGQVDRGRLAGPSRFAHLILAPVDEHHLHFGFFPEQVAVGHGQVGDLAFFQAAQAVAHAEDFRRAQGEGAQGSLSRQAGLDCLAGIFQDGLGIGEPAGVEGKLDSGLVQRRRGGRGAVAEAQDAQ